MKNYKLIMFLLPLLVLGACSKNNESPNTSANMHNEGSAEEGNIMDEDSTSEAMGSDADTSAVDTSGIQQNAVLDRVFYAYDSSEVSPQGMEMAKRQAKYLDTLNFAEVKVIVEGNCDERGTKEYNIALGERRAVALKNALVKYGVPANDVVARSNGKEQPAVIGTGPLVWKQNRRSEVKVMNKRTGKIVATPFVDPTPAILDTINSNNVN